MLLTGTLLLAAISCRDSATQSQKPADLRPQDTAAKPKEEIILKHILFFGNSLTAGYGLDDPAESWVSLIEKRIDSLNLPYTVINAGVSGETSAGGDSRINWVLSQQPVDVFVLELGANDALRGLPVPQAAKHLESILAKVKNTYPDAHLVVAGMEAPPNLGSTYTAAFREMYRRLASKYEAALIPFILEGVGGEPSLNQSDGIHPNGAGNQIIRETVWKALKDIL